MALPPISSIQTILFNAKESEAYLIEKEVFYKEISCKKCEQTLTCDIPRRAFRCNKRSCDTQYSIRIHTFFYGSRLSCSQIMHLAYNWLNKATQKQCMNETGCSSKTVTQFYKHFRKLVGSTLEENDDLIGGEGIEVQIDETKLGKRKYNRGHRVDGVWILAGVEKTVERKVFLVHVPDRTSNTLLEIIKNRVRPGSIIITDMFRSYAGLSNLGFNHMTVNHSVTFKDTRTGANTNTIEGTNNALKIQIRPRNRTKDVDDFLIEFIWRRKHQNDLWEAFIAAIREIHYDIE